MKKHSISATRPATKKARTSVTRPAIKKASLASATIEYVIPLGGTGWIVKNNKAAKFTVITDSKREAVSIARSIAKRKHNQVVVFSRNGNIEKTESYALQQ